MDQGTVTGVKYVPVHLLIFSNLLFDLKKFIIINVLGNVTVT